MDRKVIRNLSYGMYVIGACDDRNVGCTVNTVVQITSDPVTVIVSINKDNYTHGVISKTGKFSVSILGETVDPKIIGTFGYSSSKDTDKYKDVSTYDLDGMPIISDSIGGMICEVVSTMDTSTHTVFLGKVVNMANYKEENAMTYKYYREVLKGKSPKNAPTYVKEEDTKEKKTVWRCPICGYEVEADELPSDYVCPICGAPGSIFTKVE